MNKRSIFSLLLSPSFAESPESTMTAKAATVSAMDAWTLYCREQQPIWKKRLSASLPLRVEMVDDLLGIIADYVMTPPLVYDANRCGDTITLSNDLTIATMFNTGINT